MDKKVQLTKLRKALPEKKVENYRFSTSEGESVTFLDLFGDRDELIVVHNMGKGCAYCTMWADGFNGVYHHIVRKAPFFLASPDSPNVQEDLKAERGWTFPIISTQGNSFKKDLGFEIEGQYYPGVSTFRRDDSGNIYHIAKAFFGPGDDFCSVWSLFDLLPSGSSNYRPMKKINTTTPFQLTNNIALQVKNYEEAILFYKNTIGMKLEKKLTNETKLSLNGINFYIENNENGHVYFELAVDNYDKVLEILLEQNCEITKIYNEKSVMTADPFGMKFHLFEVSTNQ